MSQPFQRLPLKDAPPGRKARKGALQVLSSGGLVALPTETVYGIAARADSPAAVQRLLSLKRRDPSHGLTWHVGSRDAVRGFPHLAPLVQRLVQRYWPGPLTLVLQRPPGVGPDLSGIALDGWVGIRLPAHRGTAGLLDSLPFPVVMSSANRHGEEPLTDPDRLADLLGPEIDLLLDGGPSRIGEASGVLALGPGRFELLREGLLPLPDLQETAGLRIGFACTGNTCRSPMALGLASKALGERLGLQDPAAAGLGTFGFQLTSMGVAACQGMPISSHAVEVLESQGLDLSGHRSTHATLEAMKPLDLVYGMTSSHVDALRSQLPPSRARTVQLLDPGGEGVPDPIGGSLHTYQDCADRIRRSIEQRVDEWA